MGNYYADHYFKKISGCHTKGRQRASESETEALRGIAEGAKTDDYREKGDRF
jgi:hypothetical protein